jgi:para-nitrobenzyl esterase
MSESLKRIVLTRREAVLLSAWAGISMVGSGSPLASDSIKTAAHQEPGNCSTGRWCFHV